MSVQAEIGASAVPRWRVYRDARELRADGGTGARFVDRGAAGRCAARAGDDGSDARYPRRAVGPMSWKDQSRRRRQAMKRGRRGARRAVTELLHRVLGPAARSGEVALPLEDDRGETP